MSRLAEKLKQASGVVGRQNAKIEARADAIIAQEPMIEAQTDEAFAPHEAMLSEAQRGLDALKRELATMSNDPLESSGESSVTTERVALGPHPDQVHGLDPVSYRKFEAGMPLEAAKAVNGS